MYLKKGRGIVRTDFTVVVWLEHTNMGRMEGKQGCRGLRNEAGCFAFPCGNESHKRVLNGKVT